MNSLTDLPVWLFAASCGVLLAHERGASLLIGLAQGLAVGTGITVSIILASIIIAKLR